MFAINGRDCAGLPKALSFDSGQFLGALFCINITITDNDIVESKESFTVRLSSDFPGVSVSRALIVIEIIDNDKGI